MVKAIVLGAGGKMGGKIARFIASTEGIEAAAAVEKKGHPLTGRDFGEVLGFGKTGVTIADSLEACVDRGDVIIDFTVHDMTVNNLSVAVNHKKAIVIGTTGLSAEEINRVREIAPGTRCVMAPNMSVGVNVMFKVLENVTAILGGDYDIEIVEAHHNQKKDAPSGTAVKMAEIMAKTLGRDLARVGIYERKGMIGARKNEEIGIQTVRAGDIVGEHTVIFGGMGERLEFIHRAHSRDNFARGAIRAARWIVTQKNGLYDMQDVLGLKD